MESIVTTLSGVLDRDNSLSRSCAVKALDRLNACDEGLSRRLVKLLRDPDGDVRTDVVIALGHMQAENATGPLLENLTKDPEGGVRIQAVKALAQIGSEKAVEPLIHCFQEDGYPEVDQVVDDMEYNACWEVQSQSISALGEIGDQRAVEPLMELLEEEEYADLQENGFRVLARLNSGKAKDFLLLQLQQGNPLARRRAALAMTALPELQVDGGGIPADMLAGLTNALGDKDAGVRMYAARALGGSCNPMVVVPLTMLLNDSDPEVRSEVVGILGKMRDPTITEHLHPMLDDPARKLKRQIVEVLGEVGDPASVGPLSELLDTSKGDFLYALVTALGQIGAAGPERKLAEILADERHHYTIRIQAAQALGPILRNVREVAQPENVAEDLTGGKDGDEQNEKNKSPEEILEEAVFSDDDRIAYAALNSLVEQEPDPDLAASRLVELLRRQPLPTGLEEEGTGEPDAGDEAVKEVPDELVDLVEGHSSETSTLASILTPQAGPEQTETERDEPEDSLGVAEPIKPFNKVLGKVARASVQILAARLLAGLDSHGSSAVEALMEACEAGDPVLRREAIQALGRIGDVRGLPAVLAGLESDQEGIRSIALDALGSFGDVDPAQEYIDRLVQDPDPDIRQKVVQAMVNKTGPDVTEYLRRALNDEDLFVCRTALRGLSRDNYHQDFSARILDLMFLFTGELKNEAARALRRVGDLSGTSRLLEMLQDPDQEGYHWICIDALAELYATEA
ncbi:MAG: HEAT repeat domain-containing protein [Gammaproteobacteria bacterium]|nr:HEAT repeat domain-containing protein [Gammaproteobacteria bacterium]